MKHQHQITTQKELRRLYWDQPGTRFFYKYGRTQNDYPATVRCDWVDFVDRMARDGLIPESLAQKATL